MQLWHLVMLAICPKRSLLPCKGDEQYSLESVMTSRANFTFITYYFPLSIITYNNMIIKMVEQGQINY